MEVSFIICTIPFNMLYDCDYPMLLSLLRLYAWRQNDTADVLLLFFKNKFRNLDFLA